MKPWAYFYFPQGGQGAASQEQTTRLPQQGLWTCSYCREGGCDLASPPEHRCSDAIHLHQPWMLGVKTLDEMRKGKMMQRRKIVMKELGYFPKPIRFIYKETFMGVCKLKVQVHLWVFVFSPEQKIRWQQGQSHKGEKYSMNKKFYRNMSRSKPHLVIDSGAHIIKKSRINILSTIVQKLSQETSY
jgi:hypothetical protein